MGEQLSSEGSGPEHIMAEDSEVSFSDHPLVEQARLETLQSWQQIKQRLLEKINEMEIAETPKET